jgi:glycosyltransferase involved in cell wall biosynthesis
MEQNPLVSVVIATHNRVELLTTRAIPSVLNQTYQNFEVIIVADRCTDDTKDRVHKIKDPRIKFVELIDRPPLVEDSHTVWRVAAAAPRNKGIEVAHGEWITHLDDDDEFTPNHIQILLERAISGYDFVYGNFLDIRPNGEQVIIGEYPPKRGHIATSSHLYSSKYRNIKFNTDPVATLEPEDWNFCRRVIEAGAKVSYINEVVYIHYRPSYVWERPKEMLASTGERFLPWMQGAQIHYEHLHRYAFAAYFVKRKKVLDLACGEGYGTYILAGEAEYVAGIEIDHPTVEYAKSRYKKDNLEFMEGSIIAVPIEGERDFDVVVCFQGLEYIKEHDKLMSEVKRLLKEDGLFIISTSNKGAYIDTPGHRNRFQVKEFNRGEFESLLRRHFANMRVFGQKVYAGSNIWSFREHESGDYVEKIVKKGDIEFYIAEETSKKASYFIGLASDTNLDPLISVTDSWLTDVSNVLFNDYEKQLKINAERIAKLSRNLQEEISQMRRMQRSIPMQLVTRYQRITDKLLRSGTKRRHYYELGLTGVRVILNEGWKSFFMKVWHRLSRRSATK